jgi:Na+-transporting NADH:ubiquinone oxidoreductase subunit F
MLIIILQDIGILCAISGILALILILAQYFFMNYGDCKISINDKRDVTVKGGLSLLGSLADNKIYIPSACGGRGTCGTCRCTVLEGGGPVLPTETPFLSPADINNHVRLACQVKVKNDIKIQIPDSIFNIRAYRVVVEEIINYTYDIRGITLKLLEPTTIDFKAGQYVQLESPKYGRVKQKATRAYSISSKPEIKDKLQLIIRKVPEGMVTTWTNEFLKEGDIVNLTGPYGEFMIKDTNADMIFVSGGSGLAPIKAMLEHLEVTGSNRYMANFFGARTLKDLYLVDYMDHFKAVFNAYEYLPVLSSPEPGDNWTGKTGYTMSYFKDKLRDPKNTEAYLCGSPGMINAVVKAMVEMGVPKDKIYFDSFS